MIHIFTRKSSSIIFRCCKKCFIPKNLIPSGMPLFREAPPGEWPCTSSPRNRPLGRPGPPRGCHSRRRTSAAWTPPGSRPGGPRLLRRPRWPAPRWKSTYNRLGPKWPQLWGIKHGSLNVPIEHHPTIRYMVYNGYYKVMSNIPQMGQLPTPVKGRKF